MNQETIKLDCDSIREMMDDDPQAAKAIIELMKEVDGIDADCAEAAD